MGEIVGAGLSHVGVNHSIFVLVLRVDGWKCRLELTMCFFSLCHFYSRLVLLPRVDCKFQPGA